MKASGALRTPLLLAARLGYAARGFVYLNIGLLAFAAAIDTRGQAPGALGSLTPLAQAPAGQFWIITLGIGLACFAAWRGIQALLDPDNAGTSAKGLFKRAGQAVSALVYGGLSFALLELADELEDLGEADEQRADAQASFLLNLPFGDWLLMALGAALIGGGIANAVHGLKGGFQSGLDCSQRLRRIAKPIGRAGYIARGAAFAAMGVFIIRAGLHASAAESRGLGASLQALERQPAGSWLLAVVALGLVAFGLFGLLEARYRDLPTPDLPGS